MSASSQNFTPSRPLVRSTQRTQYQFPIYRFINWIAVGAYTLGLVAMYFLLGMFGIPAPLGWAAIVILFSVGIILLDHPKTLLNTLMAFWWLLPGNRLFGLLGLPLPSFLDELFFIPLVAVIVMQWIQGRQVKEILWYPALFGLIAILSWYGNGKGYLFPTIRATIVTLKPFILLYYCILTCPFESDRDLRRWLVVILAYGAIQFPYNCLWQGAPWPRIHPDYSGGMAGPQAGGHFCGYLSIFSLFVVIPLFFANYKKMSRLSKLFFVSAFLITLYDLVFMTDTKHGLLAQAIALFFIVLHPIFNAKLRAFMSLVGILFAALVIFYFNMFEGGHYDWQRAWNIFKSSPKMAYYNAVTKDFPNLVRFPVLGAGPGRFGSDISVSLQTPLVRRYIQPFLAEMHRSRLGMKTTVFTSGSQLAYPSADFLTVMGEYGWLGALVQYAFFAFIILKLWHKAREPTRSLLAKYTFVSLMGCILFAVELTFVVSPSAWPSLMYPIWILIGRTWNMHTEPDSVTLADQDSSVLLSAGATL